MEDTTMTKKDYMKPTMQIVQLKRRMMVLQASNYGMDRNLHEDPVDEGW